MKIVDFMVGTGELAVYNCVAVPDTSETISELKLMGCTDAEIKQLHDESDDGTLDVYGILMQKGWQFDVPKGFYKNK